MPYIWLEEDELQAVRAVISWRLRIGQPLDWAAYDRGMARLATAPTERVLPAAPRAEVAGAPMARATTEVLGPLTSDLKRSLMRGGIPHGGRPTSPSSSERPDDVVVRSTPDDGDIVIRPEKREGRVVYVLHTAPGPDQYVLPSRDEGVAQAMTFAELEQVRAWLTGEGHDFELLEDFRVVQSV